MAEFDDDHSSCDVCGMDLYGGTYVRQGLDVCMVCAEMMADLDPEDAEFWDG